MSYISEDDEVGRPYPKSLYLLVAAVVAYLIQIPPFPGIILMFMLAIGWPMLLTYGAMIGITLEVVGRRVSPWWLALPIIPLVAYEIEVVREHAVARHEISHTLALNQNVRVPFDATKSDLVLVDNSNYWGKIEPNWLLPATSVPVVYNQHIRQDTQTPVKRRKRVSSAPPPEQYSEFRIAGRMQCEEIKNLKLDANVDYSLRDVTKPERYIAQDSACLVSAKGQPSLPHTVVSQTLSDGTISGVPVSRSVITIRTPDGRTGTIAQIRAKPLSWIPFVLAGCGGVPRGKWTCFTHANRDDVTSYGEDYDLGMKTLLKALGLPLIARDLGAYGNPRLMEALLTRKQAKIDRAYVLMKRVLSDRTYKLKHDEIMPIAEDPERLHRIAPTLIAWTQANMAAERPEETPSCNDGEPSSPSCVWFATVSKVRMFQGILESGASGPLQDYSADIEALSRKSEELDEAHRVEVRRRKEERRQRTMDMFRQTLRTQQHMAIIRDSRASDAERRRAMKEMQAERHGTEAAR